MGQVGAKENLVQSNTHQIFFCEMSVIGKRQARGQIVLIGFRLSAVQETLNKRTVAGNKNKTQSGILNKIIFTKKDFMFLEFKIYKSLTTKISKKKN